MIEFRAYRPDDGPGIAELILPIQREEFGFSITIDDQPDLKDIPAFYGRGEGGFWVATSNAGRVVGSIGLLDFGLRRGALRKMFVAREWRGPKYGVAQRLLETLVGHAQARGFEAVFLGTTEKFVAAHRFYERNGFVRIAPDTLPPAFPRMIPDTRFYRLGLDLR